MRTAADYVEEHRITTVKNIDQVCVILGCLGQRDILEADRLREDLENELRQGLDWECD